MPKPFLTYAQQIQKLKDKNLVIPDKPSAAAILHRYGYFALITGYKDLLKNRTTKRYLDGTTFDDIVAIYRFDEQLRELTFRYLLHIERHIRSSLSYSFCDLMTKIKAHIWTSTSMIFRPPPKNAKWTS